MQVYRHAPYPNPVNCRRILGVRSMCVKTKIPPDLNRCGESESRKSKQGNKRATWTISKSNNKH